MPRDSIPSIPPVPPGSDPQLTAWMRALRDAVITRFGQTKNQLDRSPTVRELIDDGIVVAVTYDGNGRPRTLGPPSSDGPFSDAAAPDAPINVAVGSTPYTNRLTWDFPNAATSRITAFAEVFANSVDDQGTASLVGIGQGSFVHTVEPVTTTYYWVRFRSYADVPSPFNAVSGTAGTTPQDPSQMLALLNGALSESELTTELNTRIDDTESQVAVVTSDIAGIQGKYAVKIDVNGHVSGFGLIATANDGAVVSEMQIAVDQFSIRSPGSTALVFGVSGGSVVMDGAYIQTATITSAHITSLNANVINAGLLSASRIDIDGITLSNVGGELQVGTVDWTANIGGSSKPDDNATQNRLFRQTTAPGGTLVTGDMWYDTDDDLLYKWSGSAWVLYAPAGGDTVTNVSDSDTGTLSATATIVSDTTAPVFVTGRATINGTASIGTPDPFPVTVTLSRDGGTLATWSLTGRYENNGVDPANAVGSISISYIDTSPLSGSTNYQVSVTGTPFTESTAVEITQAQVD